VARLSFKLRRPQPTFFLPLTAAPLPVGNRSYTIIDARDARRDFPPAGRSTIVSLNGGLPFANNRIPAERISSVSQKVQDLLYPDPNQPGQGDFGLDSNFYADPGYSYDSNVYSFRVDHKISDKNILYTRVGLTIDNKDFQRGPLKNGWGAGSYDGNIPGRSVVISDTHTFSPTLVNEVKLGFNRTYSESTDVNFGVDVLSQLGIEGISNPGDDPAVGSMPQFSFGGAVPVAMQPDGLHGPEHLPDHR
jgi:hypothetical protein